MQLSLSLGRISDYVCKEVLNIDRFSLDNLKTKILVVSQVSHSSSLVVANCIIL